MSLSHGNISIFVPHIGCPHQCSFCNQVHITGQTEKPDGNAVRQAVEIAKSSKNYRAQSTEIAFFGGSFTAIDREYRLELLKAAYEYVKRGEVSGIRVSTRPDAIDDEVLHELKNHGVTAIELGAQSMNNEVLLANHRGHTKEDVIKASRLIKDYGFSLGLQMMTGLFEDTEERSVETAKSLAALYPDTVRIYPTIVLKDTYLGRLYLQNEYKPQALEDAVSLCVKITPIFESEGIKIIRMGLHSIDEASYLAGPWHPAFGELVECEKYKTIALEKLNGLPKGKYVLYVNDKEISKLTGQRKSNLQAFGRAGYDCKVKPSTRLNKYQIETESIQNTQGE